MKPNTSRPSIANKSIEELTREAVEEIMEANSTISEARAEFEKIRHEAQVKLTSAIGRLSVLTMKRD
jgi:hypothetical protein